VKVGTLDTWGMYNKPAGCSTPAYGAPHKQTNIVSTISFSSRFLVEGVFWESGVVHSFKMIYPVLCLDLTSRIPEISSIH
jgi:uncharacterized membrane protein